jgi:hypothetical protein
MKEIVLEVRCVGCNRLVTPAEVDWLMFRQTGIPLHNTKRCRDKAYNRFYNPEANQPKPRASRKKVTPTA